MPTGKLKKSRLNPLEVIEGSLVRMGENPLSSDKNRSVWDSAIGFARVGSIATSKLRISDWVSIENGSEQAVVLPVSPTTIGSIPEWN